MGVESSWAVRVPALLFSVAAVGALIGFSWERVAYPDPVEGADGEWEPPRMVEATPDRPLKWTPAEEAILQRALQHFPPYPRGSRPEVLAADYLGPDAPMAVAWFSTQDTPAQVFDHYEKLLLEAGLPVLTQRIGANGGYVGYWSPISEEIRLISALSQGGETLVFVSAGQVGKVLERASAVPAWIPFLPGGPEPTTLTFDMEGTRHHAVMGVVTDGSVRDVEARYRALLAERGWEAGDAHEMSTGGVEFDMEQEGVRGSVMLRKASSQPGVEIHLSLLRRADATSVTQVGRADP